MLRFVAVLGSLLVFAHLALSQLRLSPAPLQNQDQKNPVTGTVIAITAKDVVVAASGQWLDTGIAVNPGDKVTITGDGTLQLVPTGTISPEGMARTWRDVMQSLPLNSAGRGALIARIGGDPAVVPFLVGAKKEFTVSRPGRLFLGVNLGSGESLDGKYKASIRITPAAAVNAEKPLDLKFDSELLEQIPRRVTDSAGGAGDMVNFVLVGSKQQVLDAFANGGWVQVDRTKEEAVLHAILSTMQKQTYLEMPMSELYLYGRPQDYGMARAEPIAVVQTRHHLRIWKAPFQISGQDVWVGAATHDLGFEKDQRNGNVTHRIDPNVDEERDFVKASLTEGGGVAASTYALPNNPVQQAKTATGGSFHSDGRLVIMQLRGGDTTAAE
jgi:hypothetical protein